MINSEMVGNDDRKDESTVNRINEQTGLARLLTAMAAPEWFVSAMQGRERKDSSSRQRGEYRRYGISRFSAPGSYVLAVHEFSLAGSYWQMAALHTEICWRQKKNLNAQAVRVIRADA